MKVYILYASSILCDTCLEDLYICIVLKLLKAESEKNYRDVSTCNIISLIINYIIPDIVWINRESDSQHGKIYIHCLTHNGP